MTKAEKFNLYADTLYGMCRKAQQNVNKGITFEIDSYVTLKYGRYSVICVGIRRESSEHTTYFRIGEIEPDMEEKFKTAEDALNKILIEVPCPYCDHTEKEEED